MSSEVRLDGGSTGYEGRVRVYHNNRWGTVCDDNWDLNDAHVVCHQLFGTGAVEAKKLAFFGQGSGTIWLDDVACNGNESSLDGCIHPLWGLHNCNHGEDAGVICKGKFCVTLM